MDLQKEVNKQNEEYEKQAIQSSRDNAVGDLLTQGITDPKQLLDYLNFYDDGTPTGGDFTAEEITKTIKNLMPELEDAKDPLEKFTGNVRDFLMLQRDYPQLLPPEIDDPFKYTRHMKNMAWDYC